MSDTLKEIVQWFEEAKPNPTDKDRCVQVGVHIEEAKEMLDSMGMSNFTAATHLHQLSGLFKASTFVDVLSELSEKNRKELLDSLCDQIVTAMGVGYMMGFDMQGALAEVSRSNMSKFENGKAVFFDNGKIAKGKDYSEPDLAKFLNKGEWL